MPYLPDNREYRMMSPLEPVQDSEFIVEGYAATFEAYRMATIEGVDYYERIMPSAFEGSDMSDVIMLYDHTGRVFARQSNGTLELAVDSRGLKIRADLSLTPAARELYNDIKVGLVTQMSLAFAVDKDHFDTDTRTRVIDHFRKIYDVSAVSIPANPSTGISARYFDGVSKDMQELLAREERSKKAAILRIMLEVNK